MIILIFTNKLFNNVFTLNKFNFTTQFDLDKNNNDYNKIMNQYKNIYKLVNLNSFIYIPLISIPYEKYFIYISSFFIYPDVYLSKIS